MEEYDLEEVWRNDWFVGAFISLLRSKEEPFVLSMASVPRTRICGRVVEGLVSRGVYFRISGFVIEAFPRGAFRDWILSTSPSQFPLDTRGIAGVLAVHLLDSSSDSDELDRMRFLKLPDWLCDCVRSRGITIVDEDDGCVRLGIEGCMDPVVMVVAELLRDGPLPEYERTMMLPSLPNIGPYTQVIERLRHCRNDMWGETLWNFLRYWPYRSTSSV